LSQEELAERSGISVRGIGNLERGVVRRPRISSLRALADALGLAESSRSSFIDHYRHARPAVVADTSQRVWRTAPAELPAATSTFVGRAAELQSLEWQLRDNGGVVVIDGLAGVGKTALALRWSHQNRKHFPDGQLYANLRGHDGMPPEKPEAVLGQFLRSLGTPAQGIPSGCDARAALFRSCVADRRILVVLDNARSAEQVRPLLAAGQATAVVVTSRSRLSGLSIREGAHRITLDPLGEDDGMALLSRLVGQQTSNDLTALRQILEHCSGLPLAIQIIGDWLSAGQDPSLVGSELGDRRSRVTAFDRVHDDNSARLSTVFSWSYAALDADAARLFTCLALHLGRTVGLGAAAALADTSPEKAHEQLKALTAVHLLEAPRTDRWEYHDLLRDYALELAGRHLTVRTRHAAARRMIHYYVSRARAATECLALVGESTSQQLANYFVNQEQASTWLETELPNLVDVAEQAEALEPEQAIEVSVTLWRYLLIRADLDVGRRVHDAALRAARRLRDRSAEARALGELGAVEMQQGLYEKALAYAQEACAIGESVGDRAVVDRAISNIGVIHERLGNYPTAYSYVQRSLSMAREVEDLTRESVALNNLGSLDERLGNYDAAQAAYRDAVRIGRQANDAPCTAAALHSLGSVERLLGHSVQARTTLQEALSAARQAKRREVEGHVLVEMAFLGIAAGEIEEAERQFVQARSIARDGGLSALELKAKLGLAEARLVTGRVGEAIGLYQEACGVARQVGDPYLEGRALHGLGSACWADDQRDAARAHWRDALTRYQSLGVPDAAELADRVATLSSKTGH